jgi:hypothetical protein
MNSSNLVITFKGIYITLKTFFRIEMILFLRLHGVSQADAEV